MLKAMKKLQKKHELFQRRAEGLLIDTKLTRAKRAGECDRGDEPVYDEVLWRTTPRLMTRTRQIICGI